MNRFRVPSALNHFDFSLTRVLTKESPVCCLFYQKRNSSGNHVMMHWLFEGRYLDRADGCRAEVGCWLMGLVCVNQTSASSLSGENWHPRRRSFIIQKARNFHVVSPLWYVSAAVWLFNRSATWNCITTQRNQITNRLSENSNYQHRNSSNCIASKRRAKWRRRARASNDGIVSKCSRRSSNGRLPYKWHGIHKKIRDFKQYNPTN